MTNHGFCFPLTFPPRLVTTWLLLFVSCLGTSRAAPPAGGEEIRKWSGRDFLRLRRDREGTPIALETAIVRFEGKTRASSARRLGEDKLRVDLVAAVHLADPAYYAELNRRFRQYDAVLYELVAAPEDRYAPGEAPLDLSLVSLAQRLATGLLGLQYQLDGIDYKAPNFVHADMTPEQFRETMEARGESTWQIVLRLIAQALVQPPKNTGSTSELWEALRKDGPERELALRRWAAQQFEDLEVTIQAVEGPRGSTVLSERNKVAVRVLHQELEKKKNTVAIFYGAAHMPDMAARLQRELRLQPTQWTWLAAWDLRLPAERKPDKTD